MSDAYDLQRFVEAQEPVYETVRAELQNGRKASHWMWFIFPQAKTLGTSYMAKKFGISSQKEAEAYLQHSILDARLRECATLVNAVQESSSVEIFGEVDSKKFRSCMTLFDHVAPQDIFKDALQKYYGGEPDPLTLYFLGV
ncbi:MAG TPA: DUF1810 domain-containing protein [Pyrinomonadaceae bacterium]|jgi:uncharacterized protein (DUF1810 family)|nr:DUF1810 domain-containing protein [Pyrinomonadaceae bacterium]